MSDNASLSFLQVAVSAATGPLYLTIADAIGQAIARHELAAGDRLPPQRQLAEALHVDLTTVTRAYNEAHRRGLLEARVGRGTFVRADLATMAPADAARGAVDMSMNLPPQPREPSLRKLLQDGLTALLGSNMRALMTYRTGAGSPRDRAAAASWLHPLLGDLDPDRVLVCPGAQCALTALMTTLARPGDAVLANRLTYPGFRALAAQLGLRLVPVATDADGFVPEALEEACREVRPKAIYSVPTIHNPTATTVPPARRQALADIAVRHVVPIVEDDAYGQLPSQPLRAIVSLAAGSGYYVGTLSKCLSPGLRTAFVVAPGRLEASRLMEAIRATSLGGPPLIASLVTRWIEDGSAAALRNAIRQEATARQRIAHDLLAGAEMAAHPEGLHVWLTLPPFWDAVEFVAHLRHRGLALVASDGFAVAKPVPNAVRMCLGAAESQEALRGALLAVADALRMDAPTHLTHIV